MSWNTAVPATVTVGAVGGVIFLSGVVDWAYQREAAYKAVRYLAGIRGVDNQIVVAPAATMSDVGGDITDALGRMALIGGDSVVNVTSEGSTVYLDGRVRTWAERRAVEDAAWMAGGVADVQDRLLVTG